VRLTLQAGDREIVRAVTDRKGLDGDFTLQPCVVRQVDLTHCAFAKLVEEPRTGQAGRQSLTVLGFSETSPYAAAIRPRAAGIEAV
jgi:hypothetical protein